MSECGNKVLDGDGNCIYNHESKLTVPYQWTDWEVLRVFLYGMMSGAAVLLMLVMGLSQ